VSRQHEKMPYRRARKRRTTGGYGRRRRFTKTAWRNHQWKKYRGTRFNSKKRGVGRKRVYAPGRKAQYAPVRMFIPRKVAGVWNRAGQAREKKSFRTNLIFKDMFYNTQAPLYSVTRAEYRASGPSDPSPVSSNHGCYGYDKVLSASGPWTKYMCLNSYFTATLMNLDTSSTILYCAYKYKRENVDPYAGVTVFNQPSIRKMKFDPHARFGRLAPAGGGVIPKVTIRMMYSHAQAGPFDNFNKPDLTAWNGIPLHDMRYQVIWMREDSAQGGQYSSVCSVNITYDVYCAGGIVVPPATDAQITDVDEDGIAELAGGDSHAVTMADTGPGGGQ